MNNESLMLQLEENNALLFQNPSYDYALIGISSDGRAVYDYNKMILWLMEEDDLSYNDAVEFIEYNTIRSLPYYEKENGPIVVETLTGNNEDEQNFN